MKHDNKFPFLKGQHFHKGDKGFPFLYFKNFVIFLINLWRHCVYIAIETIIAEIRFFVV